MLLKEMVFHASYGHCIHCIQLIEKKKIQLMVLERHEGE